MQLCPVCRHCGLCPGDGTQTVPNEMQILAEGIIPRMTDIAQCEGDVFCAVDIGTTTIAVLAATVMNRAGAPQVRVLAQKSAPNPQARCGNDVLSRISAARDTAVREDLRVRVLGTIASLCASLPAPDKMVITGNTVMLTIAAGIAPEPLAAYPFTVPERFGIETTWGKFCGGALSVDSPANGTLLYVPPVVSAFVGADLVSAAAATLFTVEQDGVSLLADIGTNCETALLAGGAPFFFACTSSAAGPAFEGSNISCGMPAAPGAIARVEVGEFGAVHCSVIGGGVARGVCGSGLLSAMAALLKSGHIDSTGRIVRGDPMYAARSRGSAAIRLADGVHITQRDVRNFQLAKAAVRTGIDFLLRAYGKPCGSARLFLAGGFGCSLSPADLLDTGMVPQLKGLHIVQAGNAALTGALSLLLSPQLRSIAERHARSACSINLADEDDFQAHYVDALQFSR